MTAYEKLTACVGEWQGTNRLYYPPDELPDETPSTLSLSKSDDTLQLNYTWTYQTEPQQGTLVLRQDLSGQVIADWNDAWHTGGKIMTFEGEADEESLSLSGKYAVPPGPDWGWRILLEPGKSLSIRMFNIEPESAEEIAVESLFSRAPAESLG